MKSLKFFITGTDTEVGKTITSIGLCLSLDANYWKPIQSGSPNDTEIVSQFLKAENIYPSTYSFREPLSPQQAAQKENQKIDLNKIQLPESDSLIVEGVGGVFVPLNKDCSQLDLIEKFKLPVIVVARSGLGTLNHSLLTLEALKSRSIKPFLLILSGEPHSLNKMELQEWSDVPIYELPRFSTKNKKDFLEAFEGVSQKIKKLCDSQ